MIFALSRKNFYHSLNCPAIYLNNMRDIICDIMFSFNIIIMRFLDIIAECFRIHKMSAGNMLPLSTNPAFFR